VGNTPEKVASFITEMAAPVSMARLPLSRILRTRSSVDLGNKPYFFVREDSGIKSGLVDVAET
jgi:hypothetical protein